VSKDRARRRAEREAAAERERRRRDAARKRAQTRASVVGSVTEPASRAQNRMSRWWRRTYPKNDPFARRRRRQTVVVLLIGLAVQAVAWVLVPSWAGRAVVLVLTLFLLPVVRVVIFDRR
jgi:Flp pilus assembly protein TadB